MPLIAADCWQVNYLRQEAHNARRAQEEISSKAWRDVEEQKKAVVEAAAEVEQVCGMLYASDALFNSSV